MCHSMWKASKSFQLKSMSRRFSRHQATELDLQNLDHHVVALPMASIQHLNLVLIILDRKTAWAILSNHMHSQSLNTWKNVSSENYQLKHMLNGPKCTRILANSKEPMTPPCLARWHAASKEQTSETKITLQCNVNGLLEAMPAGEWSTGLGAGKSWCARGCFSRSIFLANFSWPVESSLRAKSDNHECERKWM